MTISTQSSSAVLLGNGVTTVFSFPFIGAAASDINVIYVASTGAQTTLSPSQYTLSLNAPVTGQIWGVGGTVTYPTSGPAIANGTSLIIQRILPLTQVTTISNQGDFYPVVTETALDTLELQIQQVSSRTGQLRGTWAVGIAYNYGDVVVDGINGLATGNYYMCANANVSSVWANELSIGDWSLAINVQALTTVPGGSNGQIQYNNAGALGGLNSTGTGNVVRANSPALITPSLDTPTAGVLTSCTGLPLTTGTTGLLPSSKGGTDNASYTVGDMLYASGATALSKLAASTLNFSLFSGGAGVAPSWGAAFKVIPFNWDLTTTGSQSVTGVGFKPSAVFLIGGVAGTSKYQIAGFSDGVASIAIANNNGSSAGTNDQNASLGYIVQSGGVLVSLAFTSFDADGITFNKAKVGSPTGTAAMVALFMR